MGVLATLVSELRCIPQRAANGKRDVSRAEGFGGWPVAGEINFFSAMF
jgi:hypothetical protein